MGEIKHGKRGRPATGILGAPPPHERIIAIRRQNYRDGLGGESWDREKFFRLCRIIHCQPEELAERYFIPLAVLKKWLKADEIPPYVALHFILLERSYFLCSRLAEIKPEPNAPHHD